MTGHRFEGDGLREAVSRRGSLLHTVRTVAWSFFGVRRGSDHEHDMHRLNPLHVVVVGVVGAAVFVLTLVALVRWVIGSGIAA